MIDNFEPNDEQIFATYTGEKWYHNLDKQVFEISGPAGSGKTSLVRYLIERLRLDNEDVLFCAFSGKAVSQLAKNGLPAKTIHSTIYNYIKEPRKDENGRIIYKKGKPELSSRFVLKDRLPKNIKLIVVDEGSMVNKDLANDLLSFGIPCIVLGDLNQLPPVFGNEFFLKNPDIKLKRIMRQCENDPIIQLSQMVINGLPLIPGIYGRSCVMTKKDLTLDLLRRNDIIITGRNSTRENINTLYRTKIKGYKTLDYPHIEEKVICRRNDWNRPIDFDNGIFLTNGTAGTVEFCDQKTFTGDTIRIDFRPDYIKKTLRNIPIDYLRLKTQGLDENCAKRDELMRKRGIDAFEYAYAITCHSAQGSQWPNVLFLAEKLYSNQDQRKFLYTGITRAMKSVTVVLS
jgi:exodeoxyribonuclease-5